jgi:hypothetical protein
MVAIEFIKANNIALLLLGIPRRSSISHPASPTPAPCAMLRPALPGHCVSVAPENDGSLAILLSLGIFKLISISSEHVLEGQQYVHEQNPGKTTFTTHYSPLTTR